MKPAWDSLAEEYASSDKVVVADVDCTAAGEPLCERFDVQGFPTIKYFNPPDDEGEDYDGERSLEELQKFAKTLGPGCGPDAKENCSAEQLEELEAILAAPEAVRVDELRAIKADIKAKEKEHDELLESLQAQYDASNKALEELKTSYAPRLKLLKLSGTKLPKEELEADDADDDADDEDADAPKDEV